MKKIISTIICLVGLVSISIAQDAFDTAKTMGYDALVASKDSGKYVYILPPDTTDETVTKAAAYYKSYFTVNFNDAEKEATLNLNPNNEYSRLVMIRFLVASGVRYVNVDGENLELNEFAENYFK